MVLRQSLVGGRRAALYSVLGNSTGLIIWGAMSSVGLSAIFAKSHLAFSILKYAGVAFLVGLAIQTLFELRNSSISPGTSHKSDQCESSCFRGRIYPAIRAEIIFLRMGHIHFGLCPGIGLIGLVFITY